jgi:uncharacterized protein YjiS (DUF1127 family)
MEDNPVNHISTISDEFASATPAKKASFLQAAVTQAKAVIAGARKGAAERQLRKELADMDDSLLRDIGVAEDEIHLIRAGHVFTPRAWGRVGARSRTA